MKTVEKFRFTLNGVEFILPRKYLKEFRYDGTPILEPFIEGEPPVASSIIKQYIKKKYPKIAVNVKSDTFSMGNSVDVWISTKMGKEIPEEVEKDITHFANQFQYGYVNSMEDMYEHSDKTINTEKGTRIDPGVKYVSVQNKPMLGTVASNIKMLKEYMFTNTYCDGGMLSLENAVKKVEYYSTPRNMEKALTLINS